MIIDDDVAIAESLRFALRKDYDLFFATNISDALSIYGAQEISVIVLDLKLGNENGMDLYHKLKEINPEVVVIIITAFGTIESSVEAIKSGIFQYLTKPIDLEDLRFSLSKAVEMDKLHRRVKFAEDDKLKSLENYGLLFYSDKMNGIMHTVNKVKNIDSIILITGESGTGKSLIAKVIHRIGHRRENPFYSINCAAIPQNLLESELFGYKRGAFTGANTDKKGFFQLADKGTLFLDEIGDLDLNLQGKLLQVIQEKKVTPLGAESSENVDVRIITATNKNLKEMIDQGKFREDLYYRLNVINILMPSLRDRKEDIPHLAQYFIDKYSLLLDKPVHRINNDFYDALVNMELRGNIRELENIIERAIALNDDDELSAKDIGVINKTENILGGVKSDLIPIFIGEKLEDIEQKVILATLNQVDNNQTRAAEILGITDRTIRNKLKKYRGLGK